MNKMKKQLLYLRINDNMIFCIEPDDSIKTLLEEVVDLPNIKSAKKRVEVTKAKTAVNKTGKSILKTNLKKFDAEVAGGNREEANSAYKAAVKTIDQAASKGIIHKNTAARKKSSVALKFNNAVKQ